MQSKNTISLFFNKSSMSVSNYRINSAAVTIFYTSECFFCNKEMISLIRPNIFVVNLLRCVVPNTYNIPIKQYY